MKKNKTRYAATVVITILFSVSILYSQISPYPDQHYLIEGATEILTDAETVLNIVATADNSGIRLSDNTVSGYIFLKPQTAHYPFDIGLPSWNGTVHGDNASFRVFVRVPYLSDWSPWLEVGYWKANLWSSKQTRYSEGRIDYDTLVLYSFATKWQLAVEMKRTSVDVPSPTVSVLSFFTSDDRTTDRLNFSDIVADAPPAIFIPTEFLAQYRLSSEYGHRICSPTTVSMILLSYGIDVDPLEFALDTLDPYYNMFGVWPRVVQNASEYGLRGMVTRYRTWSEAYDVLAKGGRIGMSIGQPLYDGHLVMLAGFNEAGDPVVHDPARTSSGYSYVFNKEQLSQAWFAKGGVGYTFYLADSTADFTDIHVTDATTPVQSIILHPNYPNPFNASTTFYYELRESGTVHFAVFNILGEHIKTLESGYKTSGQYRLTWDGLDFRGQNVATGTYFYQLRVNDDAVKTGRILYLK